LAARPESLPTLHAVLDRFWAAVDTRRGHPTPLALRYGLATAVAEVAANIIRYAQTHTFGFEVMLFPASPSDTGLEGPGDGTVEARFTDAGVPFRERLDRDFDPEQLAEGGMGLALARRGLHALEYRRLPDATNCWILRLHLPPGVMEVCE